MQFDIKCEVEKMVANNIATTSLPKDDVKRKLAQRKTLPKTM